MEPTVNDYIFIGIVAFVMILYWIEIRRDLKKGNVVYKFRKDKNE